MKQQFFLARDKNGYLYLYMGKPIRGFRVFYGKYECGTYLKISAKKSYPEVTWDNSPVEVTLQLPPELCTLH